MYSLYVHIPFCVHRCAYCDFNTYAGQEDLIPAYVEALCREVRFIGQSDTERRPVHTVFFGGGTPSLLSTVQFETILRSLNDSFDLSAEAEVSLEANPGTVTPDSLRDLRCLGFNRISLGMQSSHPDELRQLERIHDYFDVIESVLWARRAGFENLNLDLIFGLPEQSLERWTSTVKRAVDLNPEHLSLYSLTIEHGTPFGQWAARGLMPSPDPDLAADMYEWAGEVLEKAGYEQYEISNWAKPDQQCRHNLQYWRGLPYLGFGAGAHGYAAGVRYSNAQRIKTYIEHFRAGEVRPFPVSPATVNRQEITSFVEMQETMMTGLRLTKEGVSPATFRDRFGKELMEVFGKEIEDLACLGLLEQTPNVVRLTKRGRLLGNQVFMRFVG